MYGTQERTQHFFNPNYFGPKMFWDPTIFFDPNISSDPKCLCNPKFFGPKSFSAPRFYGPTVLSVQKNLDPKLKTFTWESSVALLSPTCLTTFLRTLHSLTSAMIIFATGNTGQDSSARRPPNRPADLNLCSQGTQLGSHTSVLQATTSGRV